MCAFWQCLTFGIDKYFIVIVYQWKLGKLVNSYKSWFPINIGVIPDLKPSILENTLCQNMIPKYLPLAINTYVFYSNKISTSLTLVLSEQFTFYVTFDTAFSGMRMSFLNCQFNIYLMLNQYNHPWFPVCLN